MSFRPPELTRTSRAFVRFLELSAGLSKRRRKAIAIAAMLLPPLVDALTPASFSVAFLYVIGVALAVWSVGEVTGLLLALLAVIAGAAVQHIRIETLHLPIGIPGEIWNAFARMLSLVAVAIIANGLHTALLLERWRAAYDGLTGVLNKAAFERQAATLVAQARSRGQALVLAYLDLDGFKGVNDKYGHSAGDRVLQTFAAEAAQAIRTSDLFARIGGDEFVALLVVHTSSEGDQMAETLHIRLTEVLARTGFPVTCSMGALVSDAGSMDLQHGALELADMLMYEVKSAGKNALRIAHGGREGIAHSLHAAFPPTVDDELDDLLRTLDRPRLVSDTGPDDDRRSAAC